MDKVETVENGNKEEDLISGIAFNAVNSPQFQEIRQINTNREDIEELADISFETQKEQDDDYASPAPNISAMAEGIESLSLNINSSKIGDLVENIITSTDENQNENSIMSQQENTEPLINGNANFEQELNIQETQTISTPVLSPTKPETPGTTSIEDDADRDRDVNNDTEVTLMKDTIEAVEALQDLAVSPRGLESLEIRGEVTSDPIENVETEAEDDSAVPNSNDNFEEERTESEQQLEQIENFEEKISAVVEPETSSNSETPAVDLDQQVNTQDTAQDTSSNNESVEKLKENESEETVKSAAKSAKSPNKEKPLLPKKKEFKKMTVPQPFNFQQARAKDETAQKSPEFKFKARPAPTKMLHRAPIVEPKAKKVENKTTHAQGPHFASEDRIRERKLKKESASDLPSISTEGANSNPMKASTKPGAPPKKVPPHAPTKVQPFSFAERDKERQLKKEQKMKEKLEQESVKTYKFQANPIPSYVNKLPKKGGELTNGKQPAAMKSDELQSPMQDAPSQN